MISGFLDVSLRPKANIVYLWRRRLPFCIAGPAWWSRGLPFCGVAFRGVPSAGAGARKSK